jgi:hypothetical protein
VASASFVTKTRDFKAHKFVAEDSGHITAEEGGGGGHALWKGGGGEHPTCSSVSSVEMTPLKHVADSAMKASGARVGVGGALGGGGGHALGGGSGAAASRAQAPAPQKEKKEKKHRNSIGAILEQLLRQRNLAIFTVISALQVFEYMRP